MQEGGGRTKNITLTTKFSKLTEFDQEVRKVRLRFEPITSQKNFERRMAPGRKNDK